MQINVMKSAMKSGLILGVLFSINFFLMSANFILGVGLVMAIIIVATYRVTIQFRDKECGGYINYGRALLFILLSFFYASLISAVIKLIYLQFINTNFLPNLHNEVLLFWESANIPIDETLEETANSIFKPASFSMYLIWMNMSGGTFIGLIMAAFVKKEKSIFEE
ncbi:DUF4199 domain-containing protein [Paludibacter sp. 221]|uniref:DUF4199 domain-containing protein n=1 Tax=Paludibacter sp. 221 TaxID=2302939 RepID=UPI0013D61EAA|nr:DUF4199 domain-containing protein [Paludibacter sp. 221]NDV47102.1 DUF4199 domain-containing protein [Paludibacter sp. 221]